MKYITDVPNVKHKASWSQVKAAAYGQWQAILATLIPGITQKQLSGNPAPCPACGGHDRFQYVDEGRGTWHCRKCADTSRGGFPQWLFLIAASSWYIRERSKGHGRGLSGFKWNGIQFRYQNQLTPPTKRKALKNKLNHKPNQLARLLK